jgi:predicted PurR-regulated permease PerM
MRSRLLGWFRGGSVGRAAPDRAAAVRTRTDPPPDALTHERVTPPSVVVPRWVQAIVLPLALLALWELAKAAGTVLVILLFASVVALILNPIAKFFERFVPRGLSILAVYVAVFAILTGIGILIANPIGSQVNRFADNVPHLVTQANRELDSVQKFLNRNGIPVKIEQQGQTALQTLEKDVKKSSGSIISFSKDVLGQVVSLGVDVVLTLVLSVYLLVYARQIGDLVRRLMPPGDGTHEDDYPLLVQRAVFEYVRGQLTFSTIMGLSAGVGLALFGLVGLFPDGSRYAVFFGAFYAIAEFVPYIGPIVGPVPAVLVALWTNPISAVWVLALFVALQQLEGHVVAPQVFRISLRINPILVILSLLIGYQIWGVAGALIALPIATVTRQTVVYLRGHLVLEPWARVDQPPVAPEPSPPVAPEPPGDAQESLDFEGDEVAAYRER